MVITLQHDIVNVCVCVFAGEVMASFNHVVIQTRGHWFQTNSIEHESDNCAHLLCVLPMVKIQQLSLKYDQHCCCIVAL